jgi:peptidoglycan/xylan/chitin deacetylase (PgdA/CDA1 family)
MPGVAILYHAVMERPARCDDVERGLFVNPEQFKEQMADLAQRGFTSVRLRDFAGAGEKGVLITFDDAYAHVAETVSPILNMYGFSAVMCAPAAYLGGRNTWDADTHPVLGSLQIASEPQLKEMVRGPWEIASHGWHHVDMRRLNRDERRREFVESRERLGEIAGNPVTALAYPFGLLNKSVRQDARSAGYEMAFTAAAGPWSDAFALPRHQVGGDDTLPLFRLKTSGWYDRLYRVQQLTPDWAKATARAFVGRGGSR